MVIYSFERLEVWQLARKLVVRVYRVTDNFPLSEKFGLTSQLRRAAISVPSNIAEGSGRKTSKDQAHFYGIAYSSLMELLNQLIIANDLVWLNENDLQIIRADIEIVSGKLNSLRNSAANY